MARPDPFKARQTLKTAHDSYAYYSLDALTKRAKAFGFQLVPT